MAQGSGRSVLPGNAGGNDAPQQAAKCSAAPKLTTLQWAQLVSSVRGPIVDRLLRVVNKFTGDGKRDVSKWLDDVERHCRLETVQPEEIIEFLLDGNALRLYQSMRVLEASDWTRVRGLLLRQYGLSRQQAYESLVSRRLQPDEAVDVYLDDLRRLASQICLTEADELVRLQFVRGLPAALHQHVELMPGVDAMGLNELVERVRRRVQVMGRLGPRTVGTAAAVQHAREPAKGGPVRGSLKCFRCGGDHRVRACTRKPASGACFVCGRSGHMAAQCPSRRKAADAPRSGFVQEADHRDGNASGAEMEE